MFENIQCTSGLRRMLTQNVTATYCHCLGWEEFRIMQKYVFEQVIIWKLKLDVKIIVQLNKSKVNFKLETNKY